MTDRKLFCRTLSALTANMAVSDDLLTKALNLAMDCKYRETVFYDPKFGNDELSFNATASLADLLIRSGENFELLAAISAGTAGRIATNRAVNSAVSLKRVAKNEKKIQNEGRFSSLRTNCGERKNLDFEKDSIRGIALGLIFGADPRFVRFAPESVEKVDFSKKNWRQECVKAGIKTRESEIFQVYGKDSNGENRVFTLKSCPESVILELEKACKVNRETQDTECVLWVSGTVSENWQNSKIDASVEQIELTTFVKALTEDRNLFMAAFFTAAANWLTFEGIQSRNTIYAIDSLNEQQDKTPQPFDIPEVHIREIMEFFSSNEDVMKIIEMMLNSHDYSYESVKKSRPIPIRRFKESFKLLKRKVLEICNMDPEKRLGKSGRKRARRAAEKKK